MKAYAILDGGGVKGAALAGCLKAAQEQGIQFEGYGGSSAGALVATLAAVGCSGRAWSTKRPVAADLLAAKGSFEDEWGMTMGVLSVDSETALADTGWVDDRRDSAVQIGARWDVLSRMLT